MCSSFEAPEVADQAVDRTVRGWRIAEGTTEILRLSIARGLLARHRAGGQQRADGPDT